MNLAFLSMLQVQKVEGDAWRLLSPFLVELDTDALSIAGVPGAEGRRLCIPAGFEMDFASIPRLPLAYWLVGNTAHKSAVVHDFLYSVQAPRDLADEVFRAAMDAEGVPAWRRLLMYGAVRAFGGSHYERHEEVAATPPSGY